MAPPVGRDAVDATLSCAHEIAGRGHTRERSRRTGRAAVLRRETSCGSGAPTLVPRWFAFCRWRDDGILQVICPTSQTSSRDRAGQRPPGYFAWGCFRYFWYESRGGPCGWPAGPELAAARAFTQVSFGVATVDLAV